jgi:Domain of unknown function (DUF4340)
MKSNQRTLLLVGILVLLGVGTWWLTRRASHAGSTLDTSATAFSVADTAAVDKIFIASRNGQTHTLKRVARSYWRLDDRYDVQPIIIRTLLETLSRVRVKSPVPRAARNGVIRSLAATGIKVEVYQRGELVKTFYVGNSTSDQLGTYMILADSEQPFVTHIPGFDGFLTTRFVVKPRDWRTNPVFGTPLPNLESIEVVAAGQPERTFTVRRQGSGFQVDGLPQADSLLVRRFAQQFWRVYGQNFLDSTDRRQADTLTHKAPHYVITVRSKGQIERVRLWEPKRLPNIMFAITDRDSAETMVVQTYVFNRLLANRSDFLRKVQ